jgi:hypothetical protein
MGNTGGQPSPRVPCVHALRNSFMHMLVRHRKGLVAGDGPLRARRLRPPLHLPSHAASVNPPASSPPVGRLRASRMHAASTLEWSRTCAPPSPSHALAHAGARTHHPQAPLSCSRVARRGWTPLLFGLNPLTCTCEPLSPMRLAQLTHRPGSGRTAGRARGRARRREAARAGCGGGWIRVAMGRTPAQSPGGPAVVAVAPEKCPTAYQGCRARGASARGRARGASFHSVCPAFRMQHTWKSNGMKGS